MLPGNRHDIPPLLCFQGNRARKLTHGHLSLKEKENEFINPQFTFKNLPEFIKATHQILQQLSFREDTRKLVILKPGK